MARLDGVVKDYGGHRGLGPVDLHLSGPTVGLLGPNGAGKSTLIRLLMGLIEPDSGTVHVLGENVEDSMPGIRRRIGYVPEGRSMFPRLTGIRGTAYAGTLAGLAEDQAIERAHSTLDALGLDEARYRPANNYSSGMVQRLKIAQALVHDPDLLILDEPTKGLDPTGRRSLLADLETFPEERGLNLLVSSHRMGDLERLVDEAIVLEDGRVRAEGPLDELSRGQAEAYDVRVAGPIDALTDHLDEQGITWESTGTGVRVDLTDPSMVARHVREAGLVVRRLEPAQGSLAETYQSVVEVSPDR